VNILANQFNVIAGILEEKEAYEKKRGYFEDRKLEFEMETNKNVKVFFENVKKRFEECILQEMCGYLEGNHPNLLAKLNTLSLCLDEEQFIYEGAIKAAKKLALGLHTMSNVLNFIIYIFR